MASCEVVLFHVSLHPNQLEAAALCVYAAAPFITNDVIINDCCTDENDELLAVSVSCGNDRTELLFEKRSKLSTAHARFNSSIRPGSCSFQPDAFFANQYCSSGSC